MNRFFAAILLLVFNISLSQAQKVDNSTKSWAWLGFERPEGINPIVSPDTASTFWCPMNGKPMKWENSETFNPAATIINGGIALLYRAEDNTAIGIGSRTSRIGYAFSTDGFHFDRHPSPVLFPGGDKFEEFDVPGGCEDPRICMTEDGLYVMMYTSWNRKVARLSVATSRDLVHWTKYGPAFTDESGKLLYDDFCKSGSIVTEMKDGRQVISNFDGKYLMYWGEECVNLATSKDLVHWTPMLADDGDLLHVMDVREGYFDSRLTECGPPAIKTKDGIILFYNGKNCPGNEGDTRYTADTYCAGQALFSLADPTKLIDRLDQPFFYPQADFEKSGQYPAGTVFIEGLVPMNGKWFLYYGCADSFVGVATYDPAKATAAIPQTRHQFDIQMAKPGAQIPSTMYGIFFEDINFGADGGLYAEMVKNRSFEFPQALMGWKTAGNVTVLDQGGPFERNPHYVRLAYSGHRAKITAIENEGFFGITVKKGEKYHLSFWARVPENAPADSAFVEVQICNPELDENRHAIAYEGIGVGGSEWKKYEVDLSPDEDCESSVLRVFLRNSKFGRPGSIEEGSIVDLEHVSLFPERTWKNRPGGMRQDLAAALADLHPGIFRFPGGCIVEGTEKGDRYQWKNTVGPVENRPLNLNRWQYEFDYRFYPDYYQSGGLGFFEYFQLAEDFGAEPLPVLNCGMTCQYENDIKDEAICHVAVEDLDPYIQDAVDLVEFANGGTDTQWGAVRAQMGHPEPFNLKFMAIGNEQWDYKDNPAFTSRLARFVKVLREKCPDIKIIGSTGPGSEGWQFDLLQPRMKELGVDLYDEHYYRNEEWFLTHAMRYDSYDRKGPKVFAGEYACHSAGVNHFQASLCEAAFMTGLERNADVVPMATYAPLFAHAKGWQWRPDLIWFDNTRMFRSVSYYVQQLYSLNKGKQVLPLQMAGQPVAGQQGQDGLYASAVTSEDGQGVIIKIVNTSDAPQAVSLNVLNKRKGVDFSSASVTILHSDDPFAENSLDNPETVVPHTDTIDPSTREITVGPKTFAIYRFSL